MTSQLSENCFLHCTYILNCFPPMKIVKPQSLHMAATVPHWSQFQDYKVTQQQNSTVD